MFPWLSRETNVAMKDFNVEGFSGRYFMGIHDLPRSELRVEENKPSFSIITFLVKLGFNRT